ncbi:MAG: Hsp33 family molecular chaperone HslO [Firmicutes bacterium]|nr:Hsp33 family molecular chaperone HslO [Bacillota bacterium]
MKNKDYLVRATAANGQLRAFALRTTELTNEAQKRHDLYPIPSAALGRAMTVSLVLGAMLKTGTVTVHIQGDGILKGLMTSADHQGNVRGYVGNPHAHLPLNAQGKLAVGTAIGEGTLTVVRDSGLKEPYRGTVPLQTGEIGDDFAYYFTLSEQTPSAVSVGVLVDPSKRILAAGGFVVQVMPGASETVISTLERKIATIPPISNLINEGKTPEDVLELILGELDLDFKEKMPVQFKCFCSKERFKQSLITLGIEELEELVTEEETLDLVCHFCEEHYHITIDELNDILNELKEN